MHRRFVNRREFLAACAGLAICAPALAASDDIVEYSPEAFQAAMERGEPLLLDFFAPW